MAVSYISSVAGVTIVLCLAADTKPTANANWILFETDTGTVYAYSGGSWVAASGGSGLTQAQVLNLKEF